MRSSSALTSLSAGRIGRNSREACLSEPSLSKAARSRERFSLFRRLASFLAHSSRFKIGSASEKVGLARRHGKLAR